MAKRLAFVLLGSAPVLALRRRRLRKAGLTTILNLHRVHAYDRSAYAPLEPGLFDELLNYLKYHFSIVSLAEFDEPRPRPKLILSFDDGYKDFIDVAMPILAKHGIKANQNVIPTSIESGLPPLNVLAQDFVGKAPRELVDRLEIPEFSIGDHRNLGMRLSAFLKNRPFGEQATLSEILLPQFFNWQEFHPTPVMTREEVRQVADAHEVGAHSYEHASMDHESDTYLVADVRRCRTYFEEVLGQGMHIYAFPNGSCREDQITLVRDAGVKHVLLVGERFARGGHVHHRFTFDARSMSEARFKSHGGLATIPQ